MEIEIVFRGAKSPIIKCSSLGFFSSLLQYDLMGKLRSIKHYLLLDQVLLVSD
jgi:hypothetical protein